MNEIESSARRRKADSLVPRLSSDGCFHLGSEDGAKIPLRVAPCIDGKVGVLAYKVYHRH
jgi:hypothetical protein